MAILDSALTFSDNQVIRLVTTDSTNIYDAGTARDLGLDGGTDLNLFVQVTTTLVGGTSVNFQFLGAPDNGSGAPGTYTVLAESGPILTANLVIGAKVLRTQFPAVPAGAALCRWYKFTYVLSGSYIAGNVHASVAPSAMQNSIAYPSSGISASTL